MRTSEGPLFSGNVEEESFEVSLFKDTKGTILPIFNPPIIKGNWIGNKAVKIETALVQRNHQYFEGIRSFFGLLLIFSILIPFIGIAFEFNEIKNSGETTHLLESVTQAAPAILGVYILGIYIFLLLFVHIPRFMMTHGTRRSKKLLIDVFSLGNSSDEEK